MKTNLITREGFDRLKKELDFLWKEDRPEVTKKVTWAASLGDRSENADYQYNKKRLREIDRRVRYLRKRLEQVKVVDYAPQQEGKVFFGAWGEVENEAGEVKKFRIVGPDEIYGGAKDYISIDSPMARALLKKEVDDEFSVKTPEGEKEWFVNSICYSRWKGGRADERGTCLLFFVVRFFSNDVVLITANNGPIFEEVFA